MYLFYGFFTLAGFFVWWRAAKVLRAAAVPAGQPAAGPGSEVADSDVARSDLAVRA
jgi:nicotinamide mononucleotide transporter